MLNAKLVRKFLALSIVFVALMIMIAKEDPSSAIKTAAQLPQIMDLIPEQRQKPLKEHCNLVFLKDFEYLFPDLNPNYYGMLDQLIASMGEVFFGTYYSTFTGYINRMRGYHSQNKKAYGHQVGMIDSYYFAPKAHFNLPRIMRTYSAVEPPFWSREFPVCWRDIDHDVVI